MRGFVGVIAFSTLLSISGCGEKMPLFSSPIDTEDGKLPDCLNYAIFDAKESQAVEKSFGIRDSNTCNYRVDLIKYHVGSCNNIVVKSTGGDFAGYVRIEIKKGLKTIYKIQSDYKSDKEAAFQRILRGIEAIKR